MSSVTTRCKSAMPAAGEPGASPEGPLAAALASALPRDARVLVAFSGGLDSTALLHAAVAYLGAQRVRAVHANHQLQPQCDAWAAHCAAVAARWQVVFQTERLLVEQGNTEAAARQARYRWFAQCLAPDEVLLLAHHQNDQAETALVRLLQGRGAYAMPAERAFGRGRLMRPLLELPRSQLSEYARLHALSWVEDPSNQDVSLLRNFVRHRLLAELEGTEDDARWVSGAARSGRAALHEERAAQALARRSLGALSQPLALPELVDEPIIGAAWLRWWLGAVEQPSRALLEQFVQRLRRQCEGDAEAVLALQRGMLRTWRDHLYYVPEAVPLAARYALQQGIAQLPHGVLRLAPIDDRLKVRFAEPGERIATATGTTPMNERWRQQGVPPWQRPRCPLLERAGEVIWGLGLALPLAESDLHVSWHSDEYFGLS